jgi:hypothetical protein
LVLNLVSSTLSRKDKKRKRGIKGKGGDREKKRGKRGRGKGREGETEGRKKEGSLLRSQEILRDPLGNVARV